MFLFSVLMQSYIVKTKTFDSDFISLVSDARKLLRHQIMSCVLFFTMNLKLTKKRYH